MKLIAFIFLFSLQATASLYSQQISLSVKDKPLRAVLREIRKQTGYSFFIESNFLQDAKKVNITLEQSSIDAAMESILADQPFTYAIENNVIVLHRKAEPLRNQLSFPILPDDAPDSLKVVRVKGTVTDDKGQPLVGVSIRVKGANTGTVTNAEGEYFITTNAAATLIYTYIGYLTREVKANQSQIDIVMKQLNSALDEVQVIAYGTTTKRTSTGNVSTVTAETIARQPVSNPLLALQGRVPGMFIQQTSGVSAGNVNVNIQGINSLQKGTTPFYVIDGVPYTPQNLSPTIMGSAIAGIGGSTLTYINPNDIESISILKDADATAIYGSRAANGAILITTKKGKAGKTKVDIDIQTGWGKTPRFTEMLSTSDYMALRREAKKNDNAPITASDYDINGTWDSTKSTDWQNELVGGTARFTNLQAAVSGGSENTQFTAGGGYLRETTVFPGNMADNKVNVHTNVNHKSSNQKMKVNLSVTYLQDNNSLPYTDLMSQAITLPPNAPTLYNPDGTLNWGPVPNTSNYSFNNPLSYLLRKYTSNTNNLIAHSDIGYAIIPGLELKTSLGYNRLQNNEVSISPQTAVNPGTTVNSRRTTSSDKSIESWVIEPQITYIKRLKLGTFDALLGSSFQQVKNNVLAINGSGFANDAQLENLQAAPIISINTATQTMYRYNALFGRLNYAYKDKYILTVAGRRDGSSRFGSANRFMNFYSIAGAWLFGEEELMKNMIKSLSFGKLRISYGTTGNDQIGDYQYLTLYNNIVTNIPYQQVVGLQPAGHANPYLQWELTKKINFGLDLGFFNNQVLFTGNFYVNKSSNQLSSYPLGYLTGFPNVNRNVNATIQNSGIEIQLEASPIKNRDFSWTTSFNFTAQRNKLKKFDGLELTTLAQTFVVGEPVNIKRVYPFIGVNPQTGLYEYTTSEGKASTSPSYTTDRTANININPEYFGGLSNTFNFRGITLDFMFQFVKQTGISSSYTLTGLPGSMLNMPLEVANRWQKPGDNSQYQKAGTIPNSSYSALIFSEAQYSNASYIKLRNASISYDISSKWAKKKGINKAKLYVQGQNLLITRCAIKR